MNRPPLSPSQRRARERNRANLLDCLLVAAALGALLAGGFAFVLVTLPDLPKPEPVAKPKPAPTGPAFVQNLHKPDTLRESEKR